ncbi:hypothetical protein D5H78_01860 [Vallicoccus soli]|uniref:Uncharacterized protein n=1 Tax=Vallicoccus soli TaxID=2339232 RepID=A0A3A3Z759_9ACTN|nr:hypothetical protein D5H78_01860 [Vallicoccus soli]
MAERRLRRRGFVPHPVTCRYCADQPVVAVAWMPSACCGQGVVAACGERLRDHFQQAHPELRLGPRPGPAGACELRCAAGDPAPRSA